jgi:transposase
MLAEAIGVLLLYSNRQIAKTLGVGAATVDRDVASNEARGRKKVNETKGRSASNEAFSGERAAKLVERRETGAAESL